MCVCVFVCILREFKNAHFNKFQTVVENQSSEHCSNEEGVMWRLGESKGFTAGKGERCRTAIMRTDVDDGGEKSTGQ